MNLDLMKSLIESNRISTPCYIADLDKLDSHIETMKEIVGDTISLVYAMKANPFLTKHLNKAIGKIEVCSPGELEICINQGVPGADIIFSGVNKTKADIERAMEHGVDIITLESVKHFNLIREYCEKNNTSIKVLPRLSSGAQFGMSVSDLKHIVANRDDYPYLDIVGIHYFTGTQKKKIDKDIEELELIDALINEFREVYGYECRIFEYGLGLSVPYFEGEDFEGLYEDLRTLTDYVKSMNPSYEVVFELGRFIVSACMTYLTAVDDIKSTESGNICLVDGGIHHLNYYGQNMAMRVPKIDVIHMNSEPEAAVHFDGTGLEGEWKICGSLCTFADVLVRKVELGRLSLGDVLAFNNCGAYSITEAPALFLSRRMPNIYFAKGNEIIEDIRVGRESYEINLPYVNN